MISSIFFIINGEPASKANSRRLVTIKGRPAFIKSKKALAYVKLFDEQCPQMGDSMLQGDLQAEIKIYYATRRPDLDESVILDCMQDKIYKNDRQVKRKVIEWGLDRENPRAEVLMTTIESLVSES